MNEKDFEINQDVWMLNLLSMRIARWTWNDENRVNSVFATAYDNNLIFVTREEAEAALERVKKALKGEVWDREEVDKILAGQRMICKDAYEDSAAVDFYYETSGKILNAQSPLNPKP